MSISPCPAKIALDALLYVFLGDDVGHNPSLNRFNFFLNA